MKHSLATQRRYYKQLETTKNKVVAYETINKQLLSADSTPPAPPVKRYRFMYSRDDEEKIKTYFININNIQNKELPRLSEYRKFLEEHPMEMRDAQNIRDKVKSCIRQAK